VPHVVLNGKVAIEDVFKELKPIFIRNQSYILKTTEFYIDRAKNAVIVDSLAIEGSKKTVFLVMISSRDDGFVVRIYPKIEVEKTEGVKKIIAEIAMQLIATFSTLKVGETNLQEYLK
jgi:hypothetical protein